MSEDYFGLAWTIGHWFSPSPGGMIGGDPSLQDCLVDEKVEDGWLFLASSKILKIPCWLLFAKVRH
jgi:hypothetical protein